MNHSLRIASVLLTATLFGAGCFSTPVVQNPEGENGGKTPERPTRSITYVGCTPKSATVLEPAANATVKLPLTVKMLVHSAEHPECPWTVFEAQAASMRLLDKDGVTVGRGTLTTTEDWMTTGPVNFTGEIPALSLIEGEATLVITEEDPRGEGPVEEINIPLNFTK